MMSDWYDPNGVAARLRMNELHAHAAEARRARAALRGRRLRHQVGGMLVAAGERLVR